MMRVSNLVLEKTTNVLGPAWMLAVNVLLQNAPSPREWCINELSDNEFELDLGRKRIMFHRMEEASIVQGALTAAYFALVPRERLN